MTTAAVATGADPVAPVIADGEHHHHDNDNTTEAHDVKTAADAADADPFNLSRLRLSQDYGASLGVKKAILTVPVRKPDRQWFVRTHPSADYRLETAVVELKEERETYLVDRPLWDELPGELVPKVLVTAINRQGVLFLWPIRLPGEDGRHDAWNASAVQAADLARTRWVKVASNMNLGAYDVFEATGKLPEPEWPDITFQELLKVAFRDRFITAPDHAVIRRLRGDL